VSAEIGGVEVRDPAEACPILYHHSFAPPRDEPFGPKVLQDTVGVDGREAKAIPELGLGDWHQEAVVLGKTDRLEAGMKLTEQMGHAFVRGLAPDAEQPLAGNGGINKGADPQQPGEARITLGDLAQGLVGNDGDLATGEGSDAVVHPVQGKAVKVDEVARNMDREDLAVAILQNDVAARSSIQQQPAFWRRVMLAGQVLIGPELLHPRDRRAEHTLLRVRENILLLELAEQMAVHGVPLVIGGIDATLCWLPNIQQAIHVR
jgi:hypothetical protein